MSQKGNCFDNAVIESFFGTLKAEYFHLEKCDGPVRLETGVHDYIRYYNYERIKLGLQRLSPVENRVKSMMWNSKSQLSNFWESVQIHCDSVSCQ